MKITGTFLDEITHDIPSNNWGRADWAREFQIMKGIGIDTVILIRAGCGRIATYPSQVLQREVDIYPVYEDLVDRFLTLAEENGMTFFFGTYDSVSHTQQARTIQEHLEIWAARSSRRRGTGTDTVRRSKAGISPSRSAAKIRRAWRACAGWGSTASSSHPTSRR